MTELLSDLLGLTYWAAMIGGVVVDLEHPQEQPPALANAG